MKDLRLFFAVALPWLFILIGVAQPYKVFSQSVELQPLLDRHFSGEEQEAAAKGISAHNYLTEKEQKVIAYTNLARLYPQQFAAFFVDWYREEDDEGIEKFEEGDSYYVGLQTHLLNMKAMSPLRPNKKLWRCASQWAKYSGEHSLVGHVRPGMLNLIKHDAECCDYNPSGDPMEMVLDLLVDDGIRSLGHRKIMLGKYTQVGASIQPHAQYGWCLVMDFRA